MSSLANRRRSKVVDRRFQFGIASRLLLVLSAMLAVGVALAFAPSFYVLATTDNLEALEPASAEFLTLHERLWPAMLLCFAGVFLYSLYFSHRIAGPVYRINSILRALLEDRKPEVLKVRKGDYLQETAALVELLANKIGNPEPGKRQHRDGVPPPGTPS